MDALACRAGPDANHSAGLHSAHVDIDDSSHARRPAAVLGQHPLMAGSCPTSLQSVRLCLALLLTFSARQVASATPFLTHAVLRPIAPWGSSSVLEGWCA